MILNFTETASVNQFYCKAKSKTGKKLIVYDGILKSLWNHLAQYTFAENQFKNVLSVAWKPVSCCQTYGFNFIVIVSLQFILTVLLNIKFE